MTRIHLESLVDAQHSLMAQLAVAWTDFGAKALSLTNAEKKTIFCMPAQRDEPSATLSAPITIQGQKLGELHIIGHTTKVDCTLSQRRLTLDAQMLSEALRMEYALQRMTTDVIDQQDQLMAFHQLGKTSRVHNDLRVSMAELAQVTATVLKTKYAFLALQQPTQPTIYEIYPRHAWPDDLWLNLLSVANAGRGNEEWLFQQNEAILTQSSITLRNLVMKQLTLNNGVSLILGAADKVHDAFQAPDLKLFNTIAGPAVATLENTLFHQAMLRQTRTQTEMDLARHVQMRLLPQKTPFIPGLEMKAATKPASEVGGDFYDFVDQGQGLLTFMLGDVSGKGMPAALLMAMLRTVLRDKTTSYDQANPEAIMAATNRALYRDFSDVDMFATVFMGQYDYQTHQLYYANDGHAPVIYRPANGPARLLPADAPPLGILECHLAQQYVIAFQPDDLLVVATDGFSEAEDHDGNMLGYERLLALVDELAAADTATIVQQLFEHIAHFSQGCPQSDDQTLLVLKRTTVDEP